MSTTCPGCHKAIKVEDVVVKSYLPVNDLQTCGRIRVTRRGRVAAKRVQSGDGVICEGTIEGSIETDGAVELGPKATWKGKKLQSRSLAIANGATLTGVICVPWERA
ncbi:MAG: polymer-forming cytoskeletal protein [Planctomycetota bacterium]|jgi:cytoskeletal protein CcmA (bactofilin family)